MFRLLFVFASLLFLTLLSLPLFLSPVLAADPIYLSFYERLPVDSRLLDTLGRNVKASAEQGPNFYTKWGGPFKYRDFARLSLDERLVYIADYKGLTLQETVSQLHTTRPFKGAFEAIDSSTADSAVSYRYKEKVVDDVRAKLKDKKLIK